MLRLIFLICLILFPGIRSAAYWVDADGVGSESVIVYPGACNLDWGPSLQVDGTGNPHIAFEFSNGLNDTDIYCLKWNGSAWVDADGSGQESINIHDTPQNSYHPVLRLDSSDRPHILWMDYESSVLVMYYLKWNGSAWVDADGSGQESISVPAGPRYTYHIDMVLDSSDRPHITWSNEDDLTLYYLYWNGSAWVDADGSGAESKLVTCCLSNGIEAPAMDLDSLNRPHIVWNGYYGFCDLGYLHWNGSAWVDYDGTGQENITKVGPLWGSYAPSRIIINQSEQPCILWGNDNVPAENDLSYQKWNGSSWVDVDGNSMESLIVTAWLNADETNPSMAMDSADNPCVAFEESTLYGKEIYFIKWNGTSWTDIDAGVFNELNVSRTKSCASLFPSLALDMVDAPNIAWYDYDSTMGATGLYFAKWLAGPSFTPTKSATCTPTATNSRTFTATRTVSMTSTNTATPTRSKTPSMTPTCTLTCTVTLTGTVTNTLTCTEVPTFTNTVTSTPESVRISGKGVFPNPFSEKVSVVYELTETSEIYVMVFDVSGEKIFDRGNIRGNKGRNIFIWDGKNKRSKAAASGAYIIKIRALAAVNEDRESVFKVTYLK